MGRKPNPLIQEYFQRGPKLNDNSNRYPHTCKLCGEDFPKGRIDSLTGHITKIGKCPAISESDRINACLTLHGTPNVSIVDDRLPPNGNLSGSNDVPTTESILAQQWSALEALAEASRQVDMSEKHDRPGSVLGQMQLSEGDTNGLTHMGTTGLQGDSRFELQEQFTLEHPPAGYDAAAASMTQQNLNSLLASEFHNVQTTLSGPSDHTGSQSENPDVNGSPSQSLPPPVAPDVGASMADADGQLKTPMSPTSQALNQDSSKEQPQPAPHHALVLPTAPETSTIESVAELAATTREATPNSLPNSFLDPQLVAEQSAAAAAAAAAAAQNVAEHMQAQAAAAAAAAAEVAVTYRTHHTMHVSINQQWTEISYMAEKPQPAIARDISRTPVPGHRGGVRMTTHDLSLNTRTKHARARFSAARRKEVQEVRKLGACIRCRILRKTCGKGDPCETCCKVLAPRVWRAGCVRTRLHEQLELYSAGVQVVLAQNRYNMIKSSVQISSGDSYIEGTLFPTDTHKITLRTFEVLMPKETPPPEQGEDQDMEPRDLDPQQMEPRAIMIDSDSEDTPKKIEEYMCQVLPLLIENEPSPLIRVILTTAYEEQRKSEDNLLKHALELWGLVDIIDRERQWHILEKHPSENIERLIRDSNERLGIDIYTVMLIQLNAAAERKANTTSRALLNKMQRFLQDSKVKIGFRMFLTALVFLNCVEKSTWAFRAWEQQNLRSGWPLERQPETFIGQGGNLASLLKLLLGCRRVLPTVVRSEETGVLRVAEGVAGGFGEFYKNMNVTYEMLQSRQDKAEFNPVDSRCLELTLCAQLLLGN